MTAMSMCYQSDVALGGNLVKCRELLPHVFIKTAYIIKYDVIPQLNLCEVLALFRK